MKEKMEAGHSVRLHDFYMAGLYYLFLPKNSLMPIFMIMYDVKESITIIDQFRPRRMVRMIATKITPAKPTLCLWIGVPAFIFFLNFIENIGISLTSRIARTVVPIGMNSLVLAHVYITLSGSLLT